MAILVSNLVQPLNHFFRLLVEKKSTRDKIHVCEYAYCYSISSETMRLSMVGELG